MRLSIKFVTINKIDSEVRQPERLILFTSL